MMDRATGREGGKEGWAGAGPDGASLRVLLVSPNASLRFGGEAILAVHYLVELDRLGHDVRLLTHERVRPHIEQDLPELASQVHYVSDTALLRTVHRTGKRIGGSTAGSATYFASVLLMAIAQRAEARKLVRTHRIHVVHEVTPVSPRAVSTMADLGAPVVIGPLNGNMGFPPAFVSQFGGSSGRILYRLAQAVTSQMHRIFPGKRDAALVLVANQRTRDGLPAAVRGRVETLVENGVDFDLWSGRGDARANPPPTARFVFLGRLVTLKAVHVLLQAIGRLGDDQGVELLVIGDGPDRGRLEELAESLGISDRVTFTGFLPQAECPPLVASATALLLPSLRECGGAVVLEAMAMGVPVVATNWGGPAEYLDESCGILVDPDSEEALIEGFTGAMRRLLADPDLGRRLGQNGIVRARESFSWEAKARQMEAFYRSVLDGTGERTAR